MKARNRRFKMPSTKIPKTRTGITGWGEFTIIGKSMTWLKRRSRTALRLDPTFVDAHYSLGYTYEQMGQKKKADKEYAMYRRLKKKMDQYMKEEAETR